MCRILPPAARNERVCRKDWEYKGLKIKKGRGKICKSLFLLLFSYRKIIEIEVKSDLTLKRQLISKLQKRNFFMAKYNMKPLNVYEYTYRAQ